MYKIQEKQLHVNLTPNNIAVLVNMKLCTRETKVNKYTHCL